VGAAAYSGGGLPAILRPFADGALLRGTGLRLARVTRAHAATLGVRKLEAVFDACVRCGVFLVVEGLLDPIKVPMHRWLEQHGGVTAQMSGRDEAGEHRLQLREYGERLRGYQQGTRRWDGACGTFVVREEPPQELDLQWLEGHPVLQRFLHVGSKGGMRADAPGRCQLGPYTFGGDQRREEYRGKPLKNSRSGPRTGYGGSTMHFDGMGTFVALGGLKSGRKRITAVEAADAMWALHLTGRR
jgi:hypothetical protein